MNIVQYTKGFLRVRKNAVVTTAVISSAVGAVSGYYVATKVLEERFNAKADAEIAEARRFYATLNKTDYPTPSDAVKVLIDDDVDQAMQDYSGDPETTLKNSELKEQVPTVPGRPYATQNIQVGDTGTDTPTIVINNVFTEHSAVNVADYEIPEEEKALRTSDEPYLLDQTEYDDDEKAYNHMALVYYEADEILCDDQEQVITDIDGTVGEDNLQRWGAGGAGNNMILVRNEKLELDIEVLRTKASYGELTQGIIRHSEDPTPKIRRFRGERE